MTRPDVTQESDRLLSWAEHLLAERLSDRAGRVGAAYAGPGSGRDVPAGDNPPIGFMAGLPDLAILPAAELISATGEVLTEDTDPALQYGGAQGFPALRDWLAAHWGEIDGLPLSAAHFALTNGAAGALANVCDTFLDPGDVVVVEEASFSGSIRTLRAASGRIESVPMDDDGLDVDALEELLDRLAAAGTPARLLYTIPTFQNPTGATLTLARRRRLLDLCKRHGTLVVEDEAYSELWFAGPPPPSLYALSGGEGVVKIGTFSKIVAPGLRMGWCQATPAVIDALVATRADMGASPLLHRVVARLAGTGFLDRHIARSRQHYAAKSQHALHELTTHCAGLATWNPPGGGFFVWLTLDDKVRPLALAEAAAREGVSYVGGHVFSAHTSPTAQPYRRWGPGDSPYVRLAFSHIPDDQITTGLSRLGRALESASHEPPPNGDRPS